MTERTNVSGECTDGPGERMRLGYVRVSVDGRRLLAHVAAWEAVHGQKPTGMELDHLCRNRWCRNVAHLELVTHRVNSQRAGNRKLSQEIAAAIRTAYRPRVVTRQALATKYGVSKRAVDAVLQGVFYP